MSEDFIEVKQKLIDMYNFNKSIQVELTPCGVKPILDYIDSKDKEINKLTAESTEWESKFYDLQEENERLNNIIDELEKNLNIPLQTEQARDEYCYGYNDCLEDMLNKLKELKGSDTSER